MSKKQLLVFFGLMIGIASLFFLVPIEMFDGEIVIDSYGTERIVESKLSLSYFLGIGLTEEDLRGVIDFYLTPMGYFLAFLMIVMLPFLIAIRVGLHQDKSSET